MKTLVICGFPGIGKTYFAKHCSHPVLDSDSSSFSWISPEERDPSFPGNYIEHIKKNLGMESFTAILVSSHETVRKALHEDGIEFTLVYPDIRSKEEYLERYKDRGSDDNFVKLLDDNWDEWIQQMQNEENCSHIIVLPGWHLAQALVDSGEYGHEYVFGGHDNYFHIATRRERENLG